MKKIKVLKEMPFAEVGDIVKTENNTLPWVNYYYQGSYLDDLIKGGWVEIVKEEKSLKSLIYEKLTDSPRVTSGYIGQLVTELANDIRQYENKRYKKVVEEAFHMNYENVEQLCNNIRQAIEKAGES